MNFLKTVSATLLIAGVAGCSSFGTLNHGKNGFDIIHGPKVTRNHTPSTVGLMCVGNTINNAYAGKRKVRISIGNIPDLTGKFSNEDAGYKVTQGATLMAYSALQKMDAIQVVERGDTAVFQFETNLANQKMLGDRVNYRLPDGQTINYRPVLSGKVLGSAYYITGGITEINYNIYSGGIEADVAWFGGTRRYVMNIAMDLRLVNSQTLEIMEAITLQKQIIGYETKLGVFKFFGSELVDLNMGKKTDEPVQLGVRTIIEQGVAELVGSLYRINTSKLFNGLEDRGVFGNQWITDPRTVTDAFCPRVEMIKRAPVTQPRSQPRSQPKKTKPAYIGSCNNLKDTCHLCNLKNLAKQPSVKTAGYYVQMAAFEKPEGCLSEWACLESSHGDLFESQNYIIEKSSLSTGKERHSLLVGPFTTYIKANSFCSASKSRGLDCFIRQVK